MFVVNVTSLTFHKGLVEKNSSAEDRDLSKHQRPLRGQFPLAKAALTQFKYALNDRMDFPFIPNQHLFVKKFNLQFRLSPAEIESFWRDG